MHINTRTLTKQIETNLFQSGKVRLVAALEDAELAREERRETQRAGLKDPDQLPTELGADLIATGWILHMEDRVSATEAVNLYRFTLELINPDTTEKACVAVESIKKVVTTLPPCPEPGAEPAKGPATVTGAERTR